MYRSIWERYLVRQFLGMFFFFLSCFYSLYILIDYASHTSALAHHHVQIPWQEVARYYLFVFASRAEILLPLALLIAFVHTTCKLNTRYELVAFMASGFSMKSLMKPFLGIGFFCVLLLYANEQFFLPKALQTLRYMEDATKQQKAHPSSRLIVHHVFLEDGSIVLFQNYDAVKERFFDVYWIQSIDSIYRIKFLFPNFPIPIAYFVDHFVRQENGALLQTNAYRELPLPKMKFHPDFLQSKFIDPDIFSLSELFKEFLLSASLQPNEKESKILTAFYWKITIPWLCLFTLLIPAPFCVRFSRHLPVFLIYTCSLFGLIAFYLFMDASQVVAKRQFLSPFLAICVPFLLMACYAAWHFKRVKVV